ncbi:TolC family protein [Desulfolutivibrio sulfoxidireducens]|uniref:TolC family protein n=1 Tax=Desulfolutivibrio sulfoxidireducens TaxID=2773299 RepID=UPI00159E2D2A|nr:TolC family protein [Desulfolutivibrio sulfoxidireducens]QLA21320.1 TolC family protein [Desulfolutivibrio sulfoxidireducens]
MNATRLKTAAAAFFLALALLAAPRQGISQEAGTSTDRIRDRYTPKADSAAPGGVPPKALEKKIESEAVPAFVKQGEEYAKELSAAFPVPAAPEGPLDLEKSVTRGLAANPQMQSARAQILGAEEGRRQSLANFGPVGNISYGYQRTDGSVWAPSSQTNLGAAYANQATGSNANTSVEMNQHLPYWQNLYTLQLTVTQPLFTGFKLLSSYQRAALAKTQAEAQLTNTELTLIKGVQRAFLALLKARSDVRSNQDSVARLESQYKVTQAFYDVGLKPRLDVLQAEAELATAEQNLLKAQNSVLTQTAQLNSLLNLPLEQDTPYVGELSYMPFTMTIEQCLDTAYKTRPDLFIGVKSVQIAEKDAKVAASPLYPQVQAQAGYTRKGDTPGLDNHRKSSSVVPEATTVGVSASWQVWDWGSTYFGYSQARETVKKLQADLAKMRLDVGYEVKTYHLNIQDAAKRISVARTGLDAAQEGYRMAVARYQAQVGTNTDVLDAQSRVSSAEFNLTQALSDYQSALADIYVAMGIKNIALVPN